MSEKRIPNIASEIKWSSPKTVCQTCIFRLKDRNNGRTKGADFVMCDVFPKGKPHDVMFRNAECDYYTEGDPNQ